MFSCSKRKESNLRRIPTAITTVHPDRQDRARWWLFAAAALLLAMLASGALATDVPGGPGWSGQTQQPPRIGNSGMPGYNATAIARWDVVPYQTLSDRFDIGVVAFHMNGIDRVEFAAEGGQWVAVRQPTLNTRTGVYEYVATLDPDDFDDGLIEVRARVYPKTAGRVLVLQGPINGDTTSHGRHSLFLNANGNGTLRERVRFVSPTGNDSTGTGTQQRPFRTIFRAAQDIQEDHGTAEGGVINLLAGAYSWGPSQGEDPVADQRWLTVQSAPGVTRNLVRITSSDNGGIKVRLAHIRNLTVDRTSLMAASGREAILWVENCVLKGAGRTDDTALAPATMWTGGVFVTGSTVKNVMFGLVNSAMVRDTLVTNIGADSFKNARFVVNSEVKTIDNQGVEAHPDVMQYHGSHFENVIIYGFRAVENIGAQGFFSRRAGSEGDGVFKNSAFVNYIVKSQTHFGQWQQSTEHVLFWHFEHLAEPFWIRDDSAAEDNGFYTILKDISIRNCVFDGFFYEVQSGPPANRITDECHFVRYDPWGTNWTQGDPEFVDEDGNDFHPAPGSPLLGRVDQVIVARDLDGNPVNVHRAIGPFQRESGGGQEQDRAALVSYNFRIGDRISGRRGDLEEADDRYLRGAAEPSISFDAPDRIELEVYLRTDVNSPQSIDIAVESKINSIGGLANIRAYDWNERRFKVVSEYPLGVTEHRQQVNGLLADDFVSSNGDVRLRLYCEVPLSFLLSGFEAWFDQVEVLVR